MVKVIRGILGGSLAVFLVGILASSAQTPSAKALDVDNNVDIKPSMTVTIPSTPIVMNLDPSDKSFDSKNVNISVATNNPYGYELIFSAPTGTLTNRATGNTMETLPNISGGYTESTFAVNKWGYGVDNGNYVPLNGISTLKTSDVPVNDQATTLKIGAKIDFLQPAGTYDTTLEFYAVPEIFTGGLDSGYMQNMDPMLCTEEPTLRTDSRDGSQYYVQRLEDGKCWMLDNLRLGGDKPIRLTPTDTNISSNWTLPASGTVCFSSSSCTDTGGTNGNGYTRPAINADSKDTINSDDSKNWGNGSHKYGVYYNYCAISAGEFCREKSDGSSFTLSQDICPAGWSMPDSAKYTDLNKIYASSDAADSNSSQYALSLPLAGYYYSTGVRSVGSTWGAWLPYVAQTSYYPDGPEGDLVNYYRPHYMTAGSSSKPSLAYATLFSRDDYFYYGWNARCILNAEISYQASQVTMDMISTMQQLNDLSDEHKEFLVENMSIGKNYTLKDERDGQEYTVAKLRDGNLWMTQNLNLGATDITVDLTGENTNIAGTITADEFNSWRKTSGSSYNYTGWESGDNYFTIYTSDGFSQGEYIPVSGTDDISGSSYGTLYNYYAASGGTISGQYNVNRDAGFDICPAGWRLPADGGTTTELGKLSAIYYGSLAITPVADGGAGFARAGRFSGSIPSLTGREGYYWSNRIYSVFDSYYRYFSASSSSYSNYGRYNGHSIRCIFDPHADYTFRKAGVSTLQQFKNMPMTEKLTLINSMKENHNYFLMDTRDRQNYTVAKLKDGNLWMTKNLNIGYPGTPYTAGTPLTYVAVGFAALDSTNTNMPEGAAAITADTVKGWRFNLEATTNVSDSFTAGKLTSYHENENDSVSGSPYGGRYNYVAASANTRNTATITDDATYDICPAGWRLPTGGPTGELTNLYNKYGSREAMLTPVNNGGAGIARAGTFRWVDANSSFFGDLGSSAYLWSSWLTDGTNMSIMKLDGSGVTPDVGYTRKYGASIRCVVKFDMQEFNNLTPTEKSVVIGSMETGKNYTFNDSRDGRSYTVAKLKDGNVWMTEDFKLGLTALATTINLDYTNTNTPTNHTVTAATFNGWRGKTPSYTVGAVNSIYRTEIPADPFAAGSASLLPGALYNGISVSLGTISGATNPYDAAIDICPAGWRLPKGGANSEFQQLFNRYSTVAAFTGSVSDGGASFASFQYSYGSFFGAWWSSTRSNDAGLYRVYMGYNSITPNEWVNADMANNGAVLNDREYGNRLRCMLKPVSETTKNGSWWYGQ